MISTGQINQLINALVNALFKAEVRRLAKKESHILSENRKLSDGKYDAFFYRGQFFTDHAKGIHAKGLKSGLFPSLVPQIEAHVQDMQEIEFDKLRVKQALRLILKDCKTDQDLRDALPNQMAEMIDQIKAYPRTRPEGYTIMDDPKKLEQYKLLKDRIDFYLATRLLY